MVCMSKRILIGMMISMMLISCERAWAKVNCFENDPVISLTLTVSQCRIANALETIAEKCSK